MQKSIDLAALKSSATIFNCDTSCRVSIRRAHWSQMRSPFRFATRCRIRRESTRKCRIFLYPYPWKTRRIASSRNLRQSAWRRRDWWMNPADSARTRSGSISLFPNFWPFFFQPPHVFSLRGADCASRIPIPQVDPAGFEFPPLPLSLSSRILKYWDYTIYADPIWSKMKERLWFTVCRHWFRYLRALHALICVTDRIGGVLYFKSEKPFSNRLTFIWLF